MNIILERFSRAIWRRGHPAIAWGLLFLLAGCTGEEGASGEAERPLTVSVERVRLQSAYRASRRYTGRVEAARVSDVGFEIGGRLEQVLVDEGAMVAAGEALARLDTVRLAARRDEAAAELARARARARLADATLERSRDAFEFEGISRQELDEAEQSQAALVAAVDVARARLERIDVDLRQSELRAPFDAVVTARRFDEGEVLAAGQAVLRLQEDGAPEVRVGLAAGDAKGLAPGEARTLIAGSEAVTGTVRAVLPVRSAATRTVDVIFSLPPGAPVLAGDLAELELEQRHRTEGFWLPLSALAEGARGLWTSFVAVPLEGEAQMYELVRRPVDLLHEETDRVFVAGTVRDGDLVVSDGLHRVVAGQRVRVADDTRLAGGGAP